MTSAYGKWALIAAGSCAYCGIVEREAHATSDCNQFGTHIIGPSTAYIVENNAYSDCPTSGTNCQCIDWSTNGSFSVTSDPGPAWGFPNILQGESYGNGPTTNSGMPVQVSSVTSWPITWTTSGISPGPSGTWDAMVEFWVTTYNPNNATQCNNATGGSCSNGSVTQADGAEILVWLSSSPGQSPAGQAPSGLVVVGGIPWNVYFLRGGPNTSYNPTCAPNCPSIRWNYIAYAPSDGAGGISNIATISTDFAPFFADAQTRTGSCQDGTRSPGPCLDPSWYVTSAQAGFEFDGANSGTGLSSTGFVSKLNVPHSCNLNETSTTSGNAVIVSGVATTGTGVEGDGTSVAGVTGTTSSGNGVYGTASGGWPAAGVYATSGATSDATGVVGIVSGPSSTGVWGQGQYGVFGYSTITSGIGTSGYASGSNGYGVKGTCAGSCASGGGYAVWAAGPAGGTSSWSSSDARLKKDISDGAYGIEEVRNLRPVTYRWKDENLGKGMQFGLIAQEVQNVFPELVRPGPDGNLALNYVQVVPVLIRAIQQNQADIAKLQKKRGALRASFLMQGGGAGLALGIALPLGFVVMRRRRKSLS